MNLIFLPDDFSRTFKDCQVSDANYLGNSESLTTFYRDY